MKKIIVLLLVLSFCQCADAKYVKGYYKKDGTYVSGYYKNTTSNTTRKNNFASDGFGSYQKRSTSSYKPVKYRATKPRRLKTTF